jgi:Actin interacting protein 3
LPNEITSLDTVKALFVRSFGKLLTMEYMDTPRVKIYIHDSNKDIFYELENLSEIKDRTVLKLFEADSSGRGPCGLGPSGMPPITNSDELTPLPAAASTVTPTPVPATPGANVIKLFTVVSYDFL